MYDINWCKVQQALNDNLQLLSNMHFIRGMYVFIFNTLLHITKRYNQPALPSLSDKTKQNHDMLGKPHTSVAVVLEMIKLSHLCN